MLWWLIPLSATWLLLAVRDLWAVRHLPELPPRRDGAPVADVTIVMAVRDDAAHVEQSVRALLAQQHVQLRLVVVDDRSSDGTGEVLAHVAAQDARLVVRTVRELPPDWLGKSHALHVGTADVATRWLLFTDGDAQLGADTLARAIDAAECADARHVALLPAHRRTTLLGQAALLAFQLTILRRVVAVNGDRPRSFVGTGAFNLVRTDAYRAVGGHLPLRLEVVDDVWLGWLLAKAGLRSRVWLARRDLAIDWGGTPRELVRVTTKNMFAVLRYRTWLAGLAITVLVTVLGTTFAAPWLVGAIGCVPLGAYLATAVAGVALARRMEWPIAAGLLMPFGRCLLPIALANSTWTTLRQGGVRWRGTFYPLARLRRGQVQS
jgi:glycosyltransferase involved in cell wall biosynthesis